MSRIDEFEKESLIVYNNLLNDGKITQAMDVLKTAQRIRRLMVKFYNYKPLMKGRI